MKLLSTTLVASLSATGAIAADMPQVSEPVEYVSVCDAFGTGYFQIPGKDTCMLIGGQVRTQVVSGNLIENEAAEYSALARGRVWLKTKTQAEGLTIATYFGALYDFYESSADPTFYADDAYVQVGNGKADLIFGTTTSLYSGFIGYAWMALGGIGWSDTYPLQATIRVPIDNLTFGLSVEDSDYNGGSDGLNYIGAIEYSHSLFDLKLSAALVDRGAVDFSYDGTDYKGEQSEFGYAFNANVEFKPTEATAVTLGGQYGMGASAYTGFNIGNYGLDDAIRPENAALADVAKDHLASLLNYDGATSYAIMSAVSHQITDKLSVMVEGSYMGWQLDFAGGEMSGNGFLVGSSLVYKPTAGLGIAVGAGYSTYTTDVSIDNFSGSYDVDSAQIGTRVQYTF